MRRAFGLLACLLVVGVVSPAGATAAFGFEALDVSFTDEAGVPQTQAGSHPFAMTTTVAVNTTVDPSSGKSVPDEEVRDVIVHLPPGLVGDRAATPRCSSADFLDIDTELVLPACPDSSAVGVAALEIGFGQSGFLDAPVYNLVPPPGVAAKLGFIAISGLPVTIEIGVASAPPHEVVASVTEISQSAFFYGSELTLWGDPTAAAHDPIRGSCVDTLDETPGTIVSKGSCPVPPGVPSRAFLTLPRNCAGPLITTFAADSWQAPGKWVVEDVVSPPMTGCEQLGLDAGASARATTDEAESPSGLEFELDVFDPGLTDPGQNAGSDVKTAVVALPAGMSVNPAVADGLGACARSDLARERVDSGPGEGCPQASKLGTVRVESPLLEDQTLNGALFVAEQDDPATATPGAENPFDATIALYMAVKSPQLGIMIKLAGKVEPDPRSGQIVATFGDPGAADPAFRELPQLPFSHFQLELRGGERAPLVTPPTCGEHIAAVRLTPWANPAKTVSSDAGFQVGRGPEGGACPSAPLPFAPGFTAGSLDNDAGAHTPFYMRILRQDGDQELTRLDATLPPGLLAKLAGVSKCDDDAIAAAKAKTGRRELAAPSCPPSSQIGSTIAGAGVGSQLLHVPGRLYLAGPVGDAPLSVVAIVPAVAGPFDIGTVVIREALDLDPKTAGVKIDGAASDPIPRILEGIPLKLRDVEVYVDREQFALNPTSCEPMRVGATLFGGFLDPFSTDDDVPVSRQSPFQVANCARLGFKPRLSLWLDGGVRRGDHPALRAILRPRPGDANLENAVVRLPPSAFLEQAHIGTVCTRVQFAAARCPRGAIYGWVTAFSPLLDEPLRGPIYLRSSDHPLPDLVFDLHGLVDVEASARIDTVKGGIRATFDAVPDAPLSKVIVRMRGGKKGLIVNSRHLCAGRSRAALRLAAHNGRGVSLRAPVRARCRRR